MARFLAAALVTGLVLALVGPGSARDGKQDATAILDKAIKALGGVEKLGKVKSAVWKTKGTLTFMGSDNPFTTQTTVQDFETYRQEFEAEFNGAPFKGVTVVAGGKGWMKFGENKVEMQKDALANQNRQIYLALVPVTILPLKGKGFKVEAAADEKVDGKAAAVVKATGPDGKDFTLYFDKESGLPVRLVAKVQGLMGEEFTMESTFSDFKDMAGIKKATKVVSKRDGEKFQNLEVTEFKAVDKIDPKTFTEPE